MKFGKVQMGQLHTCPLHLKLMPTTSLSHILHTEETRDNTFDYIFDDKLKWDDNTEEIVKKGQQRLYLLRKLNYFSVNQKILTLFLQILY